MTSKSHLEDKKVFLIASGDPARLKSLEEFILKRFSRSTVYCASDGIAAASKLQNATPHVFFTDLDLPKTSGLKLVDLALTKTVKDSVAIIASGQLPEDGHYLDEIVTGKIQFLAADLTEDVFIRAIAHALNYTSHKDKSEYYLRFLVPGEVLLKQGEKGDHVYFVKKGQLEAYRLDNESEIPLGKIEMGEFVGEMAYIIGENRSACVRAKTDCELVEVPIGTFDHILFKRPSWSKALMLTLAKRVKAANLKRKN